MSTGTVFIFQGALEIGGPGLPHVHLLLVRKAGGRRAEVDLEFSEFSFSTWARKTLQFCSVAGMNHQEKNLFPSITVGQDKGKTQCMSLFAVDKLFDKT